MEDAYIHKIYTFQIIGNIIGSLLTILNDLIDRRLILIIAYLGLGLTSLFITLITSISLFTLILILQSIFAG